MRLFQYGLLPPTFLIHTQRALKLYGVFGFKPLKLFGEVLRVFLCVEFGNFGRIKKPEIHRAWDLEQEIINQVIKDVFGKVNGYVFG